jgi:hypothetical protein
MLGTKGLTGPKGLKSQPGMTGGPRDEKPTGQGEEEHEEQ